MKRDRLFVVRLAAILVVGAVCITAAALYRRSLRPKVVPHDEQQEGLRLVEDILSRIGGTEFGKSERGRLLTETVSGFLRRKRVVFTADIASQALYRREADGFEALYVKVFVLSGKPVHQSAEYVAEGLFHEAVHARSARDGASIEEECDGYAAGLTAGAIVAGRKLPEVLTLDGAPVAQFVLNAYAALPRNPAYRPVGETRDWLVQKTGLR